MEYQRILQDKFEHIFNYGTTYRELKTLRGIDFSGVSLHRAQRSLSGVTFEDCRFTGAEMRDTDFNGVVFHGCDFRNADLRRVNFAGAILRGCFFDGADFAGTDLGNLNFEESDLASCSFEQASMAGARISWRLYQYFRSLGIEMKGVELSGEELQNMSFAGERLENLQFGPDADLRHASFERAHLWNVRFTGCDLTGARFDFALLEQCEFENSRFSHSLTAMERLTASFRHAVLQHCRFDRGNRGMECEQFRGADLTGTVMPESFHHFHLPLENINRVVGFSRPLYGLMLGFGLLMLAGLQLLPPQQEITLTLLALGTLVMAGITATLHGYLRHLWMLMRKLPVRFPDGTGAQLASTPWLPARLGLPQGRTSEQSSALAGLIAAMVLWGLPWGIALSTPLVLFFYEGETLLFSPLGWLATLSALPALWAGWQSLKRLP
jgi:uncharacterized protein YjbI with pentapeptide repeats